MRRKFVSTIGSLNAKALLAALAIGGSMAIALPATASVRDGVEAWSRGDYSGAVRAWEGPAQAGDADAMFNLAQAYRLGRGVPADAARAEALYASAAVLGHVQAADTYGLMLFQDGRRTEALPYVQDAARRGDARSQYLLGVAHFNGDVVVRDWTRAYALLTLANGAGLPQAAGALAEMDRLVPLAQRQEAASLAVQLQAEAQAERAAQLAAVELASGAAVMAQAPVSATPRVPTPLASAPVAPSIAAAQDAVTQARIATGTADPAQAGASFARPAAASVAAPAPVHVAAAAAVPTTPARAAPAAPAAASGPWKVQLGAFGVRENAENLWRRLASRSELAGRERLLVPAGRVTRLLAGGFASQAAANSACASLRAAGQECLVTRD